MLYERLLNSEPRIFLQASEFKKAALDYFLWAEDHPMLEEQVFQHKGAIVRADRHKLRPFTKQGLASYLGIPVSRLDSYKQRKDPEWAEAVEMIEQIIYDQKFTGAAAGLLNAPLIARDLGLADKNELSGPSGGPIQTEEISPRDIINGRLARLIATSTGDTSGAD